MNAPQHEAHTDFPADLSQPARQALAAAGYTRLEQLAGVSAKHLLALHGIGPKTIRQLRPAASSAAIARRR